MEEEFRLFRLQWSPFENFGINKTIRMPLNHTNGMHFKGYMVEGQHVTNRLKDKVPLVSSSNNVSTITIAMMTVLRQKVMLQSCTRIAVR